MFMDQGYGSSDTTPCQTLLHCLLLMVVFDATSRSYYTSRKTVTSRSMLVVTVPHRENTIPQFDVNEERFTLIIAASKTQNMLTEPWNHGYETSATVSCQTLHKYSASLLHPC